MLSEIYIKNYILVPELRMKFNPGLSVITGETGAGKSILVGSIGIILGDSPAGLEAWDKDHAIYLETCFKQGDNDELNALLQEINNDQEEELILAREISQNGKSAYYIGGRRVSAAVMKSIKPLLLDFHHQRDQQKILLSSYQLEIVDRFAGCGDLRERFRRDWIALKRLRADLDAMQKEQEEQRQMIELYRYQFAELESAAIKPGEDLSLQKEYELLSHSMDILSLGNTMNQALFESENSIFDQLGHFASQLEQYKGLNNALQNVVQNLTEALEALRSTSFELSGILDNLNPDPTRINEIEERLNLINSLLHKHRVKSVEDLLQLFEQRKAEIAAAQNIDSSIIEARKKMDESILAIIKQADELSRIRNEAAQRLSRDLEQSIRNLGMNDARFKIKIDKKREIEINKQDALLAYSETGQDSVEFLFSANTGSELKNLAAVASGGEMSRILLGIKEVLVSKESARLLILDEIDAGIGGKTADKVAACIAQIAKKHPVLCVTHLAQIAAVADTHIAVVKSAESRTSVSLSVLDRDERIAELARMLSGSASPLALKHAEELINRHNKEELSEQKI
ncbi:MAG: DNA repair protein RecN [Candidatus Cloacimonetes bacterium]|nr:DNA repair protein RecN [Candidatus Cloacimonadota bacterium]MDD4559899.1 DNA repair protein RecN [Candidatus Cloacimonadota bacterium]